MDYQIQVITGPVADVDQSAAFYAQQAGFALDVDYHPTGDFRVVQLTPPGSALLGPDRCRAHRRGARIGARHLPDRHRHRSRQEGTHRSRRQGQRHPAQVTDRRLEGRLAARPDPGRRDYASFADPDGNIWVLQEIGHRPPDTATGIRAMPVPPIVSPR